MNSLYKGMFIPDPAFTKSCAGFRNLRAANIASISVLKGKQATSLYGKKAKDGVIIIKTKKKDSLGQDKTPPHPDRVDSVHIIHDTRE